MQTLPSTVPVSCVLGGGDGEQKSRDPCDCGFADVCVSRPEPCLRLVGCSGAGGHIWLSALAGDASLEQSRNCRQCYGEKRVETTELFCALCPVVLARGLLCMNRKPLSAHADPSKLVLKSSIALRPVPALSVS